jgi:hypothetical protein
MGGPSRFRGCYRHAVAGELRLGRLPPPPQVIHAAHVGSLPPIDSSVSERPVPFPEWKAGPGGWVYSQKVELWFIFFVLLVAGLGVFAMFGYVRNETDKLELKHLLATEQFKRQIMELEGERDSAKKRADEEVAKAEERVADLTKEAEDLQATIDKLQASLDKLRRDSAASLPAPSTVPIA